MCLDIADPLSWLTLSMHEEGILKASWYLCADPSDAKASSNEEETYEVSLRIGPAAASLLRQFKLQAQQIKPSGPYNMVTKGDVLAAIEAGLKPSRAEPSTPVCSPLFCIQPESRSAVLHLAPPQSIFQPPVANVNSRQEPKTLRQSSLQC